MSYSNPSTNRHADLPDQKVAQNPFYQIIPWLALAIICPIFFTIGQGGIHLAPRFSSELTGTIILPISIFLISPLVVIILKSKVSKTLLLLLICMAVPMLIGMILASLSSSNNVDASEQISRLIQGLFPCLFAIFGYSLVSHVASYGDTLAFIRRLLIAISYVVAIFCALYLLDAWIGGTRFGFGSVSDRIWIFNNPKMKRFFPMYASVAVLVLSFCVIKLHRSYHRYISATLLIGSSLFLLQTWSRTAIFSLLVGAAVLILLCVSRRQLILLACIVIPLVPVTLILSDLSDSESASAFQRLFETAASAFNPNNELAAGDQIRFERIWSAIEFGLATPFGDGFQSRVQENLDSAQMIVAENGWLDIAVRGGAVSFTALAVIITSPWSAIWRRRKRNPTTHRDSILLICIAAQVFGVGLFWLHLATELYFGVFLWILVGLSWAAASKVARPA